MFFCVVRAHLKVQILDDMMNESSTTSAFCVRCVSLSDVCERCACASAVCKCCECVR